MHQDRRVERHRLPLVLHRQAQPRERPGRHGRRRRRTRRRDRVPLVRALTRHPEDFHGGEGGLPVAAQGHLARAGPRDARPRHRVAAEAGLAYRFDILQHTNTVKAHELLHFAKENGRQLELAEILMSAYFLEGKHVGRDDDLVALASRRVWTRMPPARRCRRSDSARPSAPIRSRPASSAFRVPFLLRHRRQVRVSGAQPSRPSPRSPVRSGESAASPWRPPTRDAFCTPVPVPDSCGGGHRRVRPSGRMRQ